MRAMIVGNARTSAKRIVAASASDRAAAHIDRAPGSRRARSSAGSASGLGLLDARDRACSKEPDHRRPVVRRRVAEGECDGRVPVHTSRLRFRAKAPMALGRRAWRNVSLKRRRLPKPAANATSVAQARRESAASPAARAASAPRRSATRRGVSKSRRSCRSPMPRRSASASTSARRHRGTLVDQRERARHGARRAAAAGEIGRALRATTQTGPKARALCADRARIEHDVFEFRQRAGQIGRQRCPSRTATKKRLSKRVSRVRTPGSKHCGRAPWH